MQRNLKDAKPRLEVDLAIFSYQGRMHNGESVQGRVEATSTTAAAAELAATGVVPIQISEVGEQVGGAAKKLNLQWRASKVGLEDLVIFSRQMYSMIRAGVPITRSLGGLADTTRNPTLARVLRDCTGRLDAGHELANSMGAHPQVFSNLFVSLVHIGETAGRLEEVFLQISEHLELEQGTRRRVQAALRYPIIVMVTLTAAMAILNIFVIPAFAGVFNSMGGQLPLPTRILIGISDFSVHYWPYILMAGAGVYFGFQWYVQTKDGELWWDGLKLRLPAVGGILERSLLARFSRTLSMTLRAGVPITRSLSLTAEAVDNQYMATRIIRMRDGIERGEDLTQAAQRSELFTPLVLQMFAIGDETGNVDGLLGEVSEYYGREVDHDLKRLGDLIEPLMIIAIGGMVLVLALGIYLPMWNLAGVMQH